jgi:NADPH:quinone reductase-like Zn-dependent oxidoreductase
VIDFTGTYGERSLPVLRPGGILVSVPSGVPREVLDLAARAGRRATGILVEPDPVGLGGLCHLVEDGQLQVKVDRVFDLEQAADAHRLAEAGHGGGKIVLRVP